ncbi:MAG: Flp pilus assembly complex ATPase component TadA [Clostridia bacterium]|nr:Flp pilus assembly complex ATPase component TadA [Clostridia bacterium]
MNWTDTRQFLSPFFPEEIRVELEMLLPGELREIRIRANRPTVFITGSRSAALPWSPEPKQLNALVEALSEHSLYARTDETSQGYITLRGGHRMGLCGRASISDRKSVLSDIGSVCIRIASEWPGSATPLLSRMNGAGSVLIIGAPGSGKTTMLRDLACQLAGCGQSLQLAIVDERSELAACVAGIPQLYVGDTADVMDGLSKSAAIPWLVRSMSPDVVITDELGSDADAAAVLDALHCGVAVCASVHGASLQDVAARPAIAVLMARRAFDFYAVLDPQGGGQILQIHDRLGNPL